MMKKKAAAAAAAAVLLTAGVLYLFSVRPCSGVIISDPYWAGMIRAERNGSILEKSVLAMIPGSKDCVRAGGKRLALIEAGGAGRPAGADELAALLDGVEKGPVVLSPLLASSAARLAAYRSDLDFIALSTATDFSGCVKPDAPQNLYCCSLSRTGAMKAAGRFMGESGRKTAAVFFHAGDGIGPEAEAFLEGFSEAADGELPEYIIVNENGGNSAGARFLDLKTASGADICAVFAGPYSADIIDSMEASGTDYVGENLTLWRTAASGAAAAVDMTPLAMTAEAVEMSGKGIKTGVLEAGFFVFGNL